MAGLVLDDVLWAIRDIRRQFQLPKPHFGLKQIEREAGARKALSEIIEATKERHGREICSKGHPLLEELGPEIYTEEIKDSAFSGYWRLSPSHVGRALRRVFEIALQTLVQSPARDPKVPIAKDRLASLASQLSKLAEKSDSLFRADPARIGAFFESTGDRDRLRLRGLPAELRWGAETLKAIVSGTRKVRVSIGSPNPQVRFAMYLTGWIEACTGRKYYERFQELLAAAFVAADPGKEAPKWVDRLGIEMHSHRRRRRAWVKSITVSSQRR